METDIYRLNSHPLRIRAPCWGGLAIRKKIAGKCRRPFSDPPGDLIDRWEHRDGRGRAPRANGSDIPFSAKRPISRVGKGVKPKGSKGVSRSSPHLVGDLRTAIGHTRWCEIMSHRMARVARGRGGGTTHLSGIRSSGTRCRGPTPSTPAHGPSPPARSRPPPRWGNSGLVH